MKLFKEHQYLLMRRESRVVIGRRAVNLWLLLAVLLATFFAIAFSAGSMAYLNDKMNDPFTNWVNINLNGGEHLEELKDSLDNAILRASLDSEITTQPNFGFDGYQREVLSSFNCCYKNEDKWQIFSTLYYEKMRSDFIAAVLSEENVIDGLSIDPDSIADNSIGVITTLENLERLGYSRDHVPAFVDYPSSSPGAEEFGIRMMEDDYARSPMPLLGVVKRLPMNKDMIAARYLERLISDGINHPFSLNNRDYAVELEFFVPDEVTNFTRDNIMSLLDDSLRQYVDPDVTTTILLNTDQDQDMLRSWKKGKVWRVYLIDDSVPIAAVNRIEHLISEGFAKQGVVRVYGYDTTEANIGEASEKDGSIRMDDIISVHFNRLDSIRAFERFVKDISNLQIEMTQVNSKENFNAVSTMANILTIALLLFSIISIIIFIVNMMQSYFQKVKRNLGTFKAFGISTSELTKVYVVIIVGIVVVALVVAMTIVWITEMILPLKEGGFKYLILWNNMTMWAVLIILISTICSVLIVMRRLLRQTPGDLIYDR